MKKILVTGSSGYIGSHLCAKLLKAGYHVVGLDKNYPTDEFDTATVIEVSTRGTLRSDTW